MIKRKIRKWIYLIKCFLFFCLDAKEPKNQDLDPFAKKWPFLLRKSPNSGGKIMGSSVFNFLPPLEQRGFLCSNTLEDLFWRKFPFFFTQKSPRSGFLNYKEMKIKS